jgi:hypothetical protein
MGALPSANIRRYYVAERTEAERQEALDWIRSRPKSLHAAMIALPPSCFVKANRPLLTPGPGKTGQVVSYVEKKDGKPANVRVREVPDGTVAAECEVGWLEVTGYWEDVTPEFVRLALTT